MLGHEIPEIDVELKTTKPLLVDVVYYVRPMFAVSAVARSNGV